MRSAFVCAALVVGLLATAPPRASFAAGPSAGQPVDTVVAQLARPPGEDRAQQCADCFADCGNRYGRVCSLLCEYASPCWSMCGDRRRECNAECNEALSCRTRRRSCELEPDLQRTALP